MITGLRGWTVLAVILTAFSAARGGQGDFGCYLFSAYGGAKLSDETKLAGDADPAVHRIYKRLPIYYQVQFPQGSYQVVIHYLDAGDKNTGNFKVRIDNAACTDSIECYTRRKKDPPSQVQHKSVTCKAQVGPDGKLRIGFDFKLHWSTDHGITAIEVIGDPATLRINCGASQDTTDKQGRLWKADRELPFPDVTIWLDKNDTKNQWVNISDEILRKMQRAGVEPIAKWGGRFTGGLNCMFYDRSGNVYLNMSATGLWTYGGPGGTLTRMDGGKYASVAKGWSLNPYGPGFVLFCSHGFNPREAYQALSWDGVTLETWGSDADFGVVDWQADGKIKPIFSKPRHNNILVVSTTGGDQPRKIAKQDGIENIGALGDGIWIYALGGRKENPTDGLYRSDDMGRTWTHVLKGVNAREGANCSTIFTYKNRSYLHTTKGLYKSTDRGRTWRLIPDSPALDYAVQPGKDDTHLVGISREEGIFESTDQGETWKKIAPPPPVAEKQQWIQSHRYYDFTWDFVNDVFYVSAPDIAYRYDRE